MARKTRQLAKVAPSAISNRSKAAMPKQKKKNAKESRRSSTFLKANNLESIESAEMVISRQQIKTNAISEDNKLLSEVPFVNLTISHRTLPKYLQHLKTVHALVMEIQIRLPVGLNDSRMLQAICYVNILKNWDADSNVDADASLTASGRKRSVRFSGVTTITSREFNGDDIVTSPANFVTKSIMKKRKAEDFEQVHTGPVVEGNLGRRVRSRRDSVSLVLNHDLPQTSPVKTKAAKKMIPEDVMRRARELSLNPEMNENCVSSDEVKTNEEGEGTKTIGTRMPRSNASKKKTPPLIRESSRPKRGATTPPKKEPPPSIRETGRRKREAAQPKEENPPAKKTKPLKNETKPPPKMETAPSKKELPKKKSRAWPFKMRLAKTFKYSDHTCETCDTICKTNVDLQLHLLGHIEIKRLQVEVYNYHLPEHFITTDDQEMYLKPCAQTKQPKHRLSDGDVESIVRKYTNESPSLIPSSSEKSTDLDLRLTSDEDLPSQDKGVVTTEESKDIEQNETPDEVGSQKADTPDKENDEEAEKEGEEVLSEGEAEVNDSEEVSQKGAEEKDEEVSKEGAEEKVEEESQNEAEETAEDETCQEGSEEEVEQEACQKGAEEEVDEGGCQEGTVEEVEDASLKEVDEEEKTEDTDEDEEGVTSEVIESTEEKDKVTSEGEEEVPEEKETSDTEMDADETTELPSSENPIDNEEELHSVQEDSIDKEAEEFHSADEDDEMISKEDEKMDAEDESSAVNNEAEDEESAAEVESEETLKATKGNNKEALAENGVEDIESDEELPSKENGTSEPNENFLGDEDADIEHDQVENPTEAEDAEESDLVEKSSEQEGEADLPAECEEELVSEDQLDEEENEDQTEEIDGEVAEDSNEVNDDFDDNCTKAETEDMDNLLQKIENDLEELYMPKNAQKDGHNDSSMTNEDLINILGIEAVEPKPEEALDKNEPDVSNAKNSVEVQRCVNTQYEKPVDCAIKI